MLCVGNVGTLFCFSVIVKRIFRQDQSHGFEVLPSIQPLISPEVVSEERHFLNTKSWGSKDLDTS
jgi:hypothetical protein